MVVEDQGWFSVKSNTRWWHRLLKCVLKMGPMPQHVAFIMDGNRRYARSHLLPSTVEGHLKGFEQLTKILEWCRDIDITEVTVYAFSIENFKRSSEEIRGIMELFEKKLTQLLDEIDQFIEKQIAVRFYGDLSFLSLRIQKLAAKVVLLTMSCKKHVINVCIAYTSQDEIKRAFEFISHGIHKGLLEKEDINEYLISKCLDSSQSKEPDILIRTSGEKRLSDFLLWQCSTCYIHFDDAMWPEFGFWNLCKAIFGYQASLTKVQEIEKVIVEETNETQKRRITNFLEWVKAKKLEDLQKVAKEPVS